MQDVSKSILQFLSESKLFDAVIEDAVFDMVIIAESIAGLFFVLALIWNFASTRIKALWKTEMKPINVEELVRTVVLMALIALYPLIFGWVMDVSELMVEVISSDTSDIRAGAVEYKKSMIKIQKEANIGEDGGFSLWSMASSFQGGGFTFLSEILLVFTQVLNTIVSVVVHVLAHVISRVLFVLGPLVIAFSIIPMWKDKLEKWFGIFINTLMVAGTLTVLDRIMYGAINGPFASMLQANPWNSIAFSLVMVILYLLSFWLTSLFVGSESAAKVLTTAVGAATTFATIGAGMASKAGMGPGIPKIPSIPSIGGGEKGGSNASSMVDDLGGN